MVVIIGNKLFRKLNIGNVLDNFQTNIRCNMSLPIGTNGYKFGYLALCCHLYENLIVHKLSKSSFKQEYPKYIEKDIDYFFDNFRPESFIKCYFCRSTPSEQKKFNQYLTSIGCPYVFVKQPRTGYAACMESLMDGKEVIVSHFSINREEVRDSWYVKKNKGDNMDYHDNTSEINILRWLHKNKKIDASLCLLEDSENIKFSDEELEPSDFIKNMIQGIKV